MINEGNNRNQSRIFEKIKNIIFHKPIISSENKDTNDSNNYQFRKNVSMTIFFELEFYVPRYDRKNKGLKANPYKKGHFLIGGTFIRTFPIFNKSIPEKHSFWIWDYKNNEKLLLEEIYKYFINSWEILQENDKYNDITVCGIGISRLDLPYLLAKCINAKIDNEISIFNHIQKSRILDLENVTIPHFNAIDNYIYSKTKGEIYKLFLDTVPTSSTIVWERFDENNYELIRKNNEKNVSELIDIYKILLKCGIIRRMRKIYKKETFEKLCEFIEDEDNKKIIEDNFLYNEAEEKYCLNEYVLDMDIQKNFIHNINLKMKIKKILENAYKLSKQLEK